MKQLYNICFMLLLLGVSEVAAQSCVGATGTAEWLIFRKMSTSSDLNYLTHLPRFPHQPDRITEVPSLMTPSRYDNYFGGLLRGFIIAPETGNYRFNITGDDQSKFSLSTDSTSANLVQLATISGWTNETEFTKYTTQTSGLVSLVAGQPYYFEAMYKEGNGGDFIRVHWRKPSTINSTTWEIVPSAYIAKQTCAQVCPPKGTPCDDGNANTTNDQYDVACNCTGTPIDVPSCVGARGGVTELFWDNVSGSNVSNLLAAPGYPLMPNRGAELTELFTPSHGYDIFGGRIRGYLKVPISGSYQFNITGDNRIRLLLGTDLTGNTATQIANTSFTSSLFEHYREVAQTSPVLTLSADTFYYIEVLHKDDWGGDNMAVYWRTPFATDTTWRYIDGSYLYHFGCELACFPQGTPCDDNNSMTFDDAYNDDCTCVGTPCTDPSCTNSWDYTPYEACGTTTNHSNDPDQSWASCEPTPSPNPQRGIGHWIRYDMGDVYALSGSQVWNYNAGGNTAQGFHHVAIDYSTDGVAWYTLGNFEWEQAPGIGGYGGFQFSELEGIVARYVLITALDNFGSGPCFGISEVALEAVQCDEAGLPCNDGLDNTINDTYNYQCECVGLSVAENTCSTPLLILEAGSLQSGHYDASVYLESASIIETGEKIRLVSGELLKLQPGFRATRGSHLIAKIDSCEQPAPEGLTQQTPHTDIEQMLRDRKAQATLGIAPNPTRVWTRISYHIPESGYARIGVFNASGQAVVWLLDGETEAGDGYKELPAHQLPSGLYHVVMQYNGNITSERMVVLD